jgi:MOSC domain-containing protein YiiM
VAGHRWDSDEAAEIITQNGGPGARLVADDGPDRFDVLNLLVATDGAVEQFGHDVRRLRPNLLLSGVPVDVEPTMPGQAIAIGEALIGVHSVRGRCVVTSIDPDTGEQDMDVFRRIHNVFGGELALNSWVVRPGTVRTGDEARLVDLKQEPVHLGGWIVGAPYPHAPPRARRGS